MGRERDKGIWEQWKRAPTDSNLQSVLRQLNPLIQREVNKWTGTLARPLLELEAKRLATEAVRSFDPNRGAALGTHVANRLKKISRISYTYQNVARMPEYQTLKFHTYNLAESSLKDKLGRDPTSSEMSDALGWSSNYLQNFQRGLRREFVESGDLPPFFGTATGEMATIDFLYNDFSPMQKKIFEHTTGYRGARRLDNPGLMKRLHMTQGQLSYQKKLLVNKIEKTMSGRK